MLFAFIYFFLFYFLFVNMDSVIQRCTRLLSPFFEFRSCLFFFLCLPVHKRSELYLRSEKEFGRKAKIRNQTDKELKKGKIKRTVPGKDCGS